MLFPDHNLSHIRTTRSRLVECDETGGLAGGLGIVVQDLHGAVGVETHATGLEDRGGAVGGGDGGQFVVVHAHLRGARVESRHGVHEGLDRSNRDGNNTTLITYGNKNACATTKRSPVSVTELSGELAVGGSILHEERVGAAVASAVHGEIVASVRLVDVHFSFLEKADKNKTQF